MQTPMIDLRGLENRWVYDVDDPPLCAACQQPVGADGHAADCSSVQFLDKMGRLYLGSDCSCGADQAPVYLHRGEGTRQRYLVLHVLCFLSRTWSPLQIGGHP